jgi:ParB-like chromosome segregation protein Spo0J
MIGSSPQSRPKTGIRRWEILLDRPDNRFRLIAGERRLHAVARLDWQTLPAYVVENLEDAAVLVRAERDENTCRKPLTPSEAVSIGKTLEELEREAARKRHQEAIKERDPNGRAKATGGKLPPVDAGKTRDRFARPWE